MFFFPFTAVHSPSGAFSDAAAVATSATVADATVVDVIAVVAVFVVVVVVVGQDGVCEFLPGHALDMCPLRKTNSMVCVPPPPSPASAFTDITRHLGFSQRLAWLASPAKPYHWL